MRVVVLAKQGVDLQASKKLTCYSLQYSTADPTSSTTVIRDLMEMLWVGPPKQVALEVVEDHSCVKFAVEVRMVEAFLDSQMFHNQSKKHSDALNVLILTSQARLVHNLVVGCRTEDLKVFADVLHMKL